jgi:tetratricopeptide (TPR) repeat protein
LLALATWPAQQAFLHRWAVRPDETLAQLLKQRADHWLRCDLQAALRVAQLLLDLAEWTPLPVARALGVTIQANALVAGGLGGYYRAVTHYEEAAAIYTALGRPIDCAKVLVGKVSALAFLGRYDEALADGQRAAAILQVYAQWQPLAGLNWNLAIVYGRQGDDMGALAKFDQVLAFYQAQGATGSEDSRVAVTAALLPMPLSHVSSRWGFPAPTPSTTPATLSPSNRSSPASSAINSGAHHCSRFRRRAR